MQNRSKVLALALFALVLPACSSTQEKTTYVAPQPVNEQAVLIQPDQEYVTRIERMARSEGADVHWVHVPTRRILANQ